MLVVYHWQFFEIVVEREEGKVMIRSLNIAKRSVIAFGLIGGLTLILGLSTILQLRSLDSILIELVDQDMPVTSEIG